MTTSIRCRPIDIAMCDAMPFQQHHECRTLHPIDAVLTDTFFMDVRSNLRHGDQVTICQYDRPDHDHRSAKVVAIATVRVVHMDGNGVYLHVIDKQTVESQADDLGTTDPATAAERYASNSNWRAEHRGRGVFSVLDEAGNEVVTGLSGEDAKAIARGDKPVPEMVAA